MTVLNPNGKPTSLRVDATGRLLVSGTGGGGGGVTNLSYTASTRVVANSNGTGFTLPLVDSTNPGLMSAADKLKVDGNFPANLTYTPSSTTAVVSNSNGTGFTIPLAVAGGNSGLMNGAQAFSANRWVIIGRGAFSARPAASANTGNYYVATDIGTAASAFSGTLFVSDGANWRPVGGTVVMANVLSSTPVATLSATGAFTLPSNILVPPGLLFPGATLRVRMIVARSTTNVSTDIRASLSPSASALQFAGTISAITLSGSTNFAGMDAEAYVQSNTVFNQAQPNWGTAQTSGVNARTMDNTVNQYVTFGVTSLGAGDTASLLGYSVILVG